MKKNPKRRSAEIALFRLFCICSFTLMLLLVSCMNPAKTQTTVHIKAEPTLTPSVSPISDSSTQTPTPGAANPTETAIATFDWNRTNFAIDITQGPVYFTTHEPSNNQFIYKYVNVTIITTPDYGQVFLNLDDLSDNGSDNSDIRVIHETDKLGTSLDLLTANGARYYYSGLHGMNYESCLEHFPFTKMDPEYYMNQSRWFGTGRDYCILTSDGRLSILRFDQSTEYSDYYKNATISFVVTTYRQLAAQALTPQPTSTPGPSPTPGRYSMLNLTLKEEAALDKSAQDFLEGVASGDKDKVGDLMDYPLALDYQGLNYAVYVNDKEEFLSVYDAIFTPDLVEIIKDASIEEDMGVSSFNDIWLIVDDCYVFFHPDGKIYEISRPSIYSESD